MGRSSSIPINDGPVRESTDSTVQRNHLLDESVDMGTKSGSVQFVRQRKTLNKSDMSQKESKMLISKDNY